MNRIKLLRQLFLGLMAVWVVAGCSASQAPGNGPSATGIVVPGPTISPADQQPTTTGEAVTTGNGQQVITLSDGGRTFTYNVGDRFLLSLGEGYDWNVTISDPAVVSRVINIQVVRGAQGVYEAHQAGSIELAASGDPVCRNAKPPCGMPSRIFQVTVIVK
jgi:hypothetical protein